MKVVLVDDEQYALENLRFLLQEFDSVEVICATDNGKEAMTVIAEEKPDVVFADIEMPDLSGIELGQWIALKAPEVKLIYITAYNQYAVDAFEVNAVDYIMKPVTMFKLERVMKKLSRLGLKAKEEKEQESKGTFRIIGNLNNQFFLIHPEDGLYIEVNQKEVTLVTEKQKFSLNHSMSYWEQSLAPYNWFRCHKSYLVNLDKVETVYPMFNSTYNMKIKNQKTEIPVSRTYIKEFRAKLGI